MGACNARALEQHLLAVAVAVKSQVIGTDGDRPQLKWH